MSIKIELSGTAEEVIYDLERLGFYRHVARITAGLPVAPEHVAELAVSGFSAPPTADEEVRVATPAESEAWADKVVAEAVPLTEDPAPKKRGRPRKSEPASEATEAAAPLEGEVLPPEPKPEPEKLEAPVIEGTAVAEPITYAACREKLMTFAIDFPDSPQISRSILNEMGYGKLSELPAERYGELLERVEAAVKGS